MQFNEDKNSSLTAHGIIWKFVFRNILILLRSSVFHNCKKHLCPVSIEYNMRFKSEPLPQDDIWSINTGQFITAWIYGRNYATHDAAAKGRGWVSYFIPHIIMDVITYPCGDQS